MELQKLYVTLTLEAKKYADGLKGAVSSAQSAGSMIAKGLAVGAAAAGAAVLAIGVSAFTVANDVQTATARMQGQLGLSEEQALNYADSLRNIYGANFGDSIADVGNAIATVDLQMARLGGVTQETLEAATINALRLRDAFQIDVAESTGAATALMNDFGLSQQQAFDFVTSGFQKGMNASGDFLDSIGEYAPQFAGLGFSAEEFFSIMETGQSSGVLGTDKMADAVKEWGIIMAEGTDGARDALAGMGISYDDIAASVSSGEADFADYFQQIVDGLSDIEDPIERQRAAIALFGTMAEDMGADFLIGIDSLSTGLDDMAGATEALDAQYNTLGAVAQGAFRKMQLALEPFGAVMLTVANAVMPMFEEGLANVEAGMAIAAGAVESFVANLQEGMAPLDAFIEAIWDIAPHSVLDALVNLRDNIIPALGLAFVTYVQPVIDFVAQFVAMQDVMIALGVVLGVILLPIIASAGAAFVAMVVAVAPLIAAFMGLVALVALLRTAWEENWGGIQEKTAAVWVVLQEVFAQLSAWVTGTLIPTLQTLYDKWVVEVWPAIQLALQTAWTYISKVFTELTAWVTGTLIPTLQMLYDKWVTEVWPTIQTVTENVWTAIEAIFTEIGRWINDNLGPWAEYLGEKFSEAFDLAKDKVDEMWKKVEPVFTVIYDWLKVKLDEAVKSIGTAWDSVMGTIGGAAETAKGKVQPLVDAITGFWNWISGKVFDFKINIPDLPDWAVPGSPLPIHTAWSNFADDMSGMDIAPSFSLPNMAYDTASAMPMSGRSGGGSSYTANTTVNVASGDDPLRALRASRLLDKIGI
jgi:phage-related minor tail protein